MPAGRRSQRTADRQPLQIAEREVRGTDAAAAGPKRHPLATGGSDRDGIVIMTSVEDEAA
jgi:hypothetical protein